MSQRLVLRDNYRQNRALANARAQAASMEDVHARFIRALEQPGDLDREVEALPDEEELARPARGRARADRAGARRPARLRQDRRSKDDDPRDRAAR